MPNKSPEISGGDQDEYWRQLNDALDKASRDYDRTVLSLASGALVVSIAFLRDIAPTPNFINLVVAAWFFFVVSIASTLVSFIASEKALLHSMAQLDKGEFDSSRGGAWGIATDVLNRIAGGAFLLGATLLVWFAVVNVPEGS